MNEEKTKKLVLAKQKAIKEIATIVAKKIRKVIDEKIIPRFNSLEKKVEILETTNKFLLKEDSCACSERVNELEKGQKQILKSLDSISQMIKESTTE